MNYGLISSVSINCCEKIIGCIRPSSDDGQLKRVAKVTAATSVFSLFTLAALIETIARASLAILIKLFTIFIPAGYFDLADDWVKFCAKSAVVNAWACVRFGYAIPGVFLDKKRVQKASEEIKNVFCHPILNRRMKEFATFHINGFPEKEPPLSPAARALSIKDVLKPHSSVIWSLKLNEYCK